MAIGKVPVLCVRCRHTESIHMYQGWGLPMPCQARTPATLPNTTWGCTCPDFTEPEPEGPDHAPDRP